MPPNPKLRISPSGPLANENEIPGTGPGFIFKSSVLVSTVTDGSLDTSPEELRQDMSGGPNNLRPQIDDVNVDNYYIISTDFDVLFEGGEDSATLSVVLEVSRDNGANWVNVGTNTISLESAIEQIVHVHRNNARLAISSIANAVTGDSLIARVLVSLSAQAGEVISAGGHGNATVSILECL